MRWIDRCLSSLRHSTMPTEVIVIDNCSTDGTRTFIPENYPEVIFKPQDKNIGFGQGNNIGLLYALHNNYDYALLLNQDAYLGETVLKELTSHSDGATLLSPLHLNGSGTTYDHNFHLYSLQKTCPQYLADVESSSVKPFYPIGEVCAACWLMPKALIEKVGGFNPLFAQYGEDNNYYQRMRYHGIGVRLVPSASVCHDRKIQGNMERYQSRQIERSMLITASNPNNGLVKTITEICLIFYRYKMQLWECATSLFRIVGKTKSIINSRKTDQGTSAWI